MGVHTGEADERDGDYFGAEVTRAARLMAIAHGGQIVCSPATADLVGGHLPAGMSLADVGVHRLRDLSEPLRVFQVAGDGLPSRFPPLLSMDAFPGNLPLRVSSFIGRDLELVRVAKALGEARVVTLMGVGGVGKTRLALRAAAEELPRYREGAWLVELQAVRDPAAVVGAVAAVFRLADRAGMTILESLIEFLASKQLLLVLDNCEHLLDPVAELVEAVERACPGVVVLATSRESLALEGERVMPVPSLAAPATEDADVSTVAECEAVRLFVERAGWVDPDFALMESNAQAVAQVCRRLDGLPLAIELAAARIGAMTSAELARGLHHRFDTLAGGRRRAVQRHQTLRAAIDWSYQLCSEAEQRLLARLAVFAGGCSREAAEQVCGGDPLAPGRVFELLAGLVAKSLVVAQRDGPTTRYRLLETIREYGEDRLAEYGETGPLRRRHAEYYWQLEAELAQRLEGREELDAHRRLAAERDNLLAAVNYAINTADADLGLRLVRHNPAPGQQLGFGLYLPVPVIVDLPGAASHDLYPYALAVSAVMASLGELDRVEDSCQEALQAARRLNAQDERREVEYVMAVARAQWLGALGDWRGTAAHYEQAAEIARDNGREVSAAANLADAAYDYTMAGDAQAGIDIAKRALEMSRAAGGPMTIAYCLAVLAGALAEAEPPQAHSLLEEALDLRDSLAIETTNEVLASTFAAAHMGDWPLTLQQADRSVRHLQWLGSRPYLAGILNVVARALAATDEEAAARLQGAARHLAPHPAAGIATVQGRSGPDSPAAAPHGSSLITYLRRQTSGLLHDALDEGRLRQLRAEGEAMDSDQAAAYALEAIGRARQSTAL
jgi:predicted ATPase